MLALILLLLLLVLNPYTVLGPLAYYLGLPMAFVGMIAGTKLIRREILFCFFVLIVISLVGVSSSVLHGITQFDHFKTAASILTYYLIGVGICVIFKKQDINNVLIAALCVAVLNGVVILLQIQFPMFRAVVESFFVESGNIDWTEGFRYRGLASGGGASLSVFSACMVYVCLYLYGIKRIHLLMSTASLAVIIASLFFIGRTGVVLIPLAFAFYIASKGCKNIKNIALSIVIFCFIFFAFLGYIKAFLFQVYGAEFYRYSLGFLLEGVEGIQSEGTVDIILGFLGVLPNEFPEVFVGYGFYGGSDFYPWTDSGYSRMFLSVGFLFGFLAYVTAFNIFIKSAQGRQKLFWPLIVLLAIAEAKEGMMFAGYSSRLLFILMGFWTAKKLQIYRLASREAATLDVL